MPRWSRLPMYLLAVIVLGELASESAGSWPVGDSYPAVPMILLVLAAWSAAKGPQAAARVGAILFWFIIIMYMIVFASGAKQIRWEWTRPVNRMPQPMSLIVLLVPSAATLLPAERNRFVGKQVLAVIVALVAALLTQGILSAEIVGEVEHPFYEMSRSLDLLGIAQRFEAIVCAAATVGWFAIMSLFLSISGEIFHWFKMGWQGIGVWLAALAAGVWLLCGLHISGWILAGTCAVFWVLLPIAAQGIEKIKKS